MSENEELLSCGAISVWVEDAIIQGKRWYTIQCSDGTCTESNRSEPNDQDMLEFLRERQDVQHRIKR